MLTRDPNRKQFVDYEFDAGLFSVAGMVLMFAGGVLYFRAKM